MIRSEGKRAFPFARSSGLGAAFGDAPATSGQQQQRREIEGQWRWNLCRVLVRLGDTGLFVLGKNPLRDARCLKRCLSHLVVPEHSSWVVFCL